MKRTSRKRNTACRRLGGQANFHPWKQRSGLQTTNSFSAKGETNSMQSSSSDLELAFPSLIMGYFLKALFGIRAREKV